MKTEDQVSMMERHDRQWATLPDELSADRPELEEVIRHVVSKCFDLHVSHIAEILTGVEGAKP